MIAYAFQITLIAIGAIMWASALVHGRVHKWLDAPVRLPEWRISGIDFLLFAFGVLAVWFLEPFLLKRVLGQDLTPPIPPATFLIHGYAFQLCGLAVFLLFRLLPAGRAPSSDVYTVVALGRGLLGVLYCMPLMAAAKMIWEFGLHTLGLPVDLQDVVTNFREVAETGGAPAWIFMLVVVAPISEECIFRGALFRFLVTRMSLRWATTISSILFALLHQNLFSFLPLALLGAVLSLVYAKTGRLIAPIILHMVFNLISVVFILLLGGS
jgi:membrane protease YdiL (CAAX protease family)